MSVNLVNKTTGALTRVAGDGIIYSEAPIGTIFAYMGDNIPKNYLLCNGETFDQSQYPELYSMLGTDKVPDLRECVLVGAGQSTRAILDTEGHAHDVYALGEFKDDQVGNHSHDKGTMEISGDFSCRSTKGDWDGRATGAFGLENYDQAYNSGSGSTSGAQRINFYASRTWTGRTSNPNNRHGDTTRQKSVGVNFIIKAKNEGIPSIINDIIKSKKLSAWSKVTQSNYNLVECDVVRSSNTVQITFNISVNTAIEAGDIELIRNLPKPLGPVSINRHSWCQAWNNYTTAIPLGFYVNAAGSLIVRGGTSNTATYVGSYTYIAE